MKVSRAGVTISNVGAILLGFVASGVATFCMRWLWPAMALPIFFSLLSGLGLSGISMILRDRGKREVLPMSLSTAINETALASKKLPDGFKTGLWEYIKDFAVAVISGFVLSSFIAGLVGLLWPGARWAIFFVVFLIWGGIGIGVIFQDLAARQSSL